ncbi:hypothetical protein Lal_00016803 [Lupinus albus]|nr:hypothetical protein Lal_00016803 [Lupinus albus]
MLIHGNEALNTSIGVEEYKCTVVLNQIVTYVRNILAPVLGLPLNQQAAAEENIWLQGNGPYFLGSFQPSIADLSLVCEIMQLEVLVRRLLKRKAII